MRVLEGLQLVVEGCWVRVLEGAARVPPPSQAGCTSRPVLLSEPGVQQVVEGWRMRVLEGLLPGVKGLRRRVLEGLQPGVEAGR